MKTALALTLSVLVGLPAAFARRVEQVHHHLDHEKSLGLALRLDPTGGRLDARLVGKVAGHDKPLIKGLSRDLIIMVNNRPMRRLPHDGQRFELPVDGGQALEIEVNLFDRTVGRYRYDPGEGRLLPQKGAARLSAYDLRQLSQQGRRYGARWAQRQASGTSGGRPSIAELHTHFGGALRAESIVKVAARNKVPYPTQLLDELGIRYKQDAVITHQGRSCVPLSARTVGRGGLRRLRARLSLRPEQVVHFGHMSDLYRYRGPLVKDVGSFGEYLYTLARDYQKMGVRYAELSISDIVKPEFLGVAHRVLPKIEQQTGVKLRFVVGLWRHSDPRYNSDMVAKIRAARHSPYIVGADFMGRETNSSRELIGTIKELAAFRRQHNPGFQIRVHAGENPQHPENVYEAIKAGATRIGHGLYGVDSRVLALARERGVIVEFNLNSNLALNNIRHLGEIPIKAYLDAGVRVTLSTDGHGLYTTSNKSELAVARYTGLTRADLRKIRGSDLRYIRAMEQTFRRKRRQPGSMAMPTHVPRATFTDADWEAAARRGAEKRLQLERAMSERGIVVQQEGRLLTAFRGRKPLLISGGNARSWKEASGAERRAIRTTIRKTLSTLDPDRVVIIAGAARQGVDGVVQREARRFGLQVLGVASERTRPEDLGAIARGLVMGQRRQGRSAALLRMVKERGGKAVFVNGDHVVQDEIQLARNIGVDFSLMRGGGGASRRAAGVFSGHAFDTAGELRAMWRYPRRRDLPPHEAGQWRGAVQRLEAQGRIGHRAKAPVRRTGTGRPRTTSWLADRPRVPVKQSYRPRRRPRP